MHEKIVEFLEENLEQAGAEGYVIGVSGGLDSAVTLKLAVEAAGSENVTAWIMPGDPSREENMEDAKQLCSQLGVETREVDIETVVSSFSEQLELQFGEEAVGNLRARVRMCYQYLDANEKGNMVLGSGNRSEYLLGYFTKHGDGAADLKPLLDLYKTEVKELAEQIGLDEKFIEKQPTAGLWEGQTDEDELGATYDEIDSILCKLVDEDLSVDEASEELPFDRSEIERIHELYIRTMHKRSEASYPTFR